MAPVRTRLTSRTRPERGRGRGAAPGEEAGVLGATHERGRRWRRRGGTSAGNESHHHCEEGAVSSDSGRRGAHDPTVSSTLVTPATRKAFLAWVFRGAPRTAIAVFCLPRHGGLVLDVDGHVRPVGTDGRPRLACARARVDVDAVRDRRAVLEPGCGPRPGQAALVDRPRPADRRRRARAAVPRGHRRGGVPGGREVHLPLPRPHPSAPARAALPGAHPHLPEPRRHRDRQEGVQGLGVAGFGVRLEQGPRAVREARVLHAVQGE